MISPPPDYAVSSFPNLSAIDSCSVSNLTCSALLLEATKQAGLCFVLAEFVRFECLVKKRSANSDADRQAMVRLARELDAGVHFTVSRLSVDDLREVARLRTVRRLGLGELAAMVLARKIRGGLVTDDRGARTLVGVEYGEIETRTVPHLVGWLIYSSRLGDNDVQIVVTDNKILRGDRGNIGNFIMTCYNHARMLQLKQRAENAA